MLRLEDVMRREFVVAAPEDTIGEVAQQMVDVNVGAAVVTDFGRLVGILTERDLMKAMAGRVHSSEARVREWMTPDPMTVGERTSVEEAGRIMLENGFRHLPVVEGERAVGIVSIRDLAQWGLEQTHA